MNPVLKQALKGVVKKCTSCTSTGRPHNSRRISFGKLLASFNDHVQIDFFFVDELDNDPIFHMVDYHTGFSATALGASRNMDACSREFELKWINVHGPPDVVSADLEFFNNKFVNSLKYFGVEIQPRPARRHQKMGVVERKHTSIRLLIQRILRDARYFSLHRGTSYDKSEILSRATYLSNILYGSKTLSSFEMARGYTPSIAGLPQCEVSQHLIQAHEEQVSRRALKKLDGSRSPQTLDPCLLERDKPVYYFKRDNKFGKWMNGFVRMAEPHFVSISSRKNHQGKPIRAAYEDVRLVPDSSLLQEMDSVDFIFPRSYSVVDEDFELQQDESVPLPPLFPELPTSVQEQPTEVDDSDPVSVRAQNVLMLKNQEAARTEDKDEVEEDLPDLQLDATDADDVRDMIEREASLWCTKKTYLSSLGTSLKSKRTWLNLPVLDIGEHLSDKLRNVIGAISSSFYASQNGMDITQAHEPQLQTKDIGDVDVRGPAQLPFSLSSSEQQELQKLKEIVGVKPTTEFHIQSLPRWVIDKAIHAEKKAYEGAYDEMDIKSLPRGANVISSHHFFQLKHDGEADKLKLKCRLVPHGNRDKDKDTVRKDSATAQFPVIRLVLSLAALLRLSIASIDIKGAYLQGGYLSRDIYMRPPKGWAPHGKVWKLTKPAYGIVESGRLWLLAVENWMSGQGIESIPGLPQLFVKYHPDGRIMLAIAKVVDDFLIVGANQDVEWFRKQISTRFTVGRFVEGPRLVFNRLHITQLTDFSIRIEMKEYLETILPIEIDRVRRKQQDDRCTPAELTAYQSLAGSLNFLGHGVLPQASFAASRLQQAISALTVEGLVTANKMLKEIKSLAPVITFPSPSTLNNPCYLAFADASQPASYGQTGYLSGVYLSTGEGAALYHVLDWLSCKQNAFPFHLWEPKYLLQRHRLTAVHLWLSACKWSTNPPFHCRSC